jgi:hypothetical protein
MCPDGAKRVAQGEDKVTRKPERGGRGKQVRSGPGRAVAEREEREGGTGWGGAGQLGLLRGDDLGSAQGKMQVRDVCVCACVCVCVRVTE